MSREGIYADTTLRDILGLNVGDPLTGSSGGNVPEYDSNDAGKVLQVNSTGTELEWANRIIVLDLINEVYSQLASVMQSGVTGAITAGLGVPYYVGVMMNNIFDTDAWDAYTEKLKLAFEKKCVIVVDTGDAGATLYYPLYVNHNPNNLLVANSFHAKLRP